MAGVAIAVATQILGLTSSYIYVSLPWVEYYLLGSYNDVRG